MASKGISTAGIQLAYIVASGSAIPSTGTMTVIPEVKTVPNLFPTPNALQTTPLNERKGHTYTGGLSDVGGMLEFTVNLTDELLEVWNEDLFDDIASGQTGDVCWFEVKHPNLTEAVWFIGEPNKLGFGEASVDSVLESTISIAPLSAPDWGAKL